MSLGLVVLEKLLTHTHTSTPQSDDIKMDNDQFILYRDNKSIICWKSFTEFIDNVYKHAYTIKIPKKHKSRGC